MPGEHPQQRLPRRVERERPGQSEADGFAAGLAGGAGEHLARWLWNRLTSPRWGTTTPFGLPVEPDVWIT
ncbi:hypothetical protein NJ76_18715 [Rhodococcus sp. IITR03]|nr:hypothetical protein NJ76_18715 [Rhodococcus sp. IITR03]